MARSRLTASTWGKSMFAEAFNRLLQQYPRKAVVRMQKAGERLQTDYDMA